MSANCRLSVRVRYRNVQPDPAAQLTPLVEVQFYDENRATIGDQMFGSPRGSSDWKTEAKKIDRPRCGPARRSFASACLEPRANCRWMMCE